MPMDMYFYEYTKQLHEYRYQRYKQQQQQQQQQRNAEPIRKDDFADLDISLKLPAVLDGCKNDGRILKCNQTDPYFKNLEMKYAATNRSYMYISTLC